MRLYLTKTLIYWRNMEKPLDSWVVSTIKVFLGA